MKEKLWLDNKEYRQEVEDRIKEDNDYVNGGKSVDGNPFKVNTVEHLACFVDIDLKIETYKAKGYFAYTRFLFFKSGKEIGRFTRNYHASSYKFFKHSNGNRYFVGGFDYQGYTIINLDDETINHYLPKGATKGCGWCPTEWKDYDVDSNELDVEGCYWGAEFEVRTYDLSEPEILPWKLLAEETVDQDLDEEDD